MVVHKGQCKVIFQFQLLHSYDFFPEGINIQIIYYNISGIL